MTIAPLSLRPYARGSMLETTIRIDAEQRNLLYRFLDHYAEAIETLDDPERTGVGRAVLEALEIDGDQALYELPTSPEVRAFLTECRDCEWETIDCGVSTDPERSADLLATAERLLLDFEPEGSALFL
jgi:hypothetical protein